MRKKILAAVCAILLSAFFGAFAFAQYTGFDLEEAKPPRLLPTTGPGDRAIINQLQQTNRLLEQSNQILTDQNRLLKQLITESRKRPE